MIGRGTYGFGAVWVAKKVPDGHIHGHANQARIRTFVQNNPSTSRFSHDVIDFARNVSNLKNANSTEFNKRTKYPVIDLMPKL